MFPIFFNMAKPNQSLILDLKKIAPSIWERRPSQPIEKSIYLPKSPDLVLLFSWTGAQSRHILVIATTINDLCFRSSTTKQRYLPPAVERVLSLGTNISSSSIIHGFSEDGSNKAVAFTEAFSSKPATNRRARSSVRTAHRDTCASSNSAQHSRRAFLQALSFVYAAPSLAYSFLATSGSFR
jgi:hypothetical protein